MEDVHDKKNDKVCNACDNFTIETANLERHIRSVHQKIKEKECEQCECFTI